MRAGPEAMAELPRMLRASHAARSRSWSRCRSSSPRRCRRSRARPRRCSGSTPTTSSSPVTRHALVVLESIDAIDLAFDTFACTLLDGETDTSGYPEYNAIVGGVASHWDEATGDMIVRGVVGWGGRGVRGDTDRIAQRILAGILTNILASQYRHGPDRRGPPGPRGGPWRPGLRALRLRVRPRARVLLSQVRDAAAPRLIPPPHRSNDARSTTTSAPPATTGPTSCTGSTIPGPRFCPSCGAEGTMRKQFARARDPLQGIRLGEEGPRRLASARGHRGCVRAARLASRRVEVVDAGDGLLRRPRRGVLARLATVEARRPVDGSSSSGEGSSSTVLRRRRTDADAVGRRLDHAGRGRRDPRRRQRPLPARDDRGLGAHRAGCRASSSVAAGTCGAAR